MATMLSHSGKKNHKVESRVAYERTRCRLQEIRTGIGADGTALLATSKGLMGPVTCFHTVISKEVGPDATTIPLQ